MKIYKEKHNIYINRIECSFDELPQALKALDDNLSEVGRITLLIDDRIIYIYHQAFSGNKSATTYYATYWDKALRLACRGLRKQKYIELYQEIKKLYKEQES